MRPQQRRLDGQRDVERATVVKNEDRDPVGRRCLLRAGSRWWARLYPLRGEPLLYGALELVIGRLATGGWRRAMRMGAMIAVVANDRRWLYDR